jgi:hypothetical protein
MCQAWERNRHSVVRIASFFFGFDAPCATILKEDTKPESIEPRQVLREIMVIPN